MPPRIRIHPVGNMGNQMLQYLFALKLKEARPNLGIYGHDLPLWGLGAPVPADFPERPPTSLHGHLASASFVGRLLRLGLLGDFGMKGLAFQMANYFAAPECSAVFRSALSADDAPFWDDGHLVINIRAAEIMGAKHADYGPLPLSFYDAAIARSGARPVFMGQIDDGFYGRALRELYPDAIFQPSRGPLADFETLRRARRLAMAVSTFSFLGVWMSQAREIHFPVSGMFNPDQRPDIDLIPGDDPRFVFYDFPVRRWTAAPEQIRWLTEAPPPPPLSVAALTRRRRAAKLRRAPEMAGKMAWFAARALVARAR